MDKLNNAWLLAVEFPKARQRQLDTSRQSVLEHRTVELASNYTCAWRVSMFINRLPVYLLTAVWDPPEQPKLY